jgi:hypothetical protein
LAGFAAVLTACTTGAGKVDSTLGSAQPGPAQQQSATAQPGVAPDPVQDLRAYCPKTVMRAGTGTYNVFPEKMKKDDPESAKLLRFRATITEVVRECNYAGDMLAMKVGVAGRLISGPSSESGQFLMPIRVAVTRGDEVLYTKLHEVMAEIPPGRTNGAFSFVDSQIVFPKPTQENIIVYVGYDEQREDPQGKGASAQKKPLPKVN